jgi:type VI secretion system (T6SS) effector TldE1-like protein
MTCATVAFPQAVAFDGRPFALRDCHRVIFGSVVIGLGTMAAACITVACVTVAAAWIVAASLSANPYIHARVSMGPETIALNYRYPILAAAPDIAASVPLAIDRGYAPNPLLEAELTLSPPPTFAPSDAVPLLTNRFTRRADDLPSASLTPPHIQATHAPVAGSTVEADLSPATAANSAPTSNATVPTAHTSEPGRRKEVVPQVEVAPAPPPASGSHKFLPSPQPHRDSIWLPGADGHTAVYDIEAHTVYLPDGDTLEAHSGLGKRLDDPRYVSEKNRGPTPPNVYDLVLRGEPFHGVRAIRLNPVGEGNMFGRDGMLAHTYMLGPSGQSFGCVSFRDYHAFLQAFLEGEVNRLIVVPHLRATVFARRSLSSRTNRSRSASDG